MTLSVTAVGDGAQGLTLARKISRALQPQAMVGFNQQVWLGLSVFIYNSQGYFMMFPISQWRRDPRTAGFHQHLGSECVRGLPRPASPVSSPLAKTPCLPEVCVSMLIQKLLQMCSRLARVKVEGSAPEPPKTT